MKDKLYVLMENQIVDAIIMSQEYTQGHGHVYNIDEILKSLPSPVVLPTDEEIAPEVTHYAQTESYFAHADDFYKGAKWMRDKILNQLSNTHQKESSVK